MKKYLVIVILLLSATAYGFGGLMMGSGTSGGGAACTTPDNGDMFDEGWDEPGPTLSWTEVNATIDTAVDISGLGTPPNDVCDYGVQFTADNSNPGVYWDHSSTIDSTTSVEVLMHIYVPANAMSLGAYSNMPILQWGNGTSPVGGGNGEVIIRNNSGTGGKGGTYIYRCLGATNANAVGVVTTGQWDTLTLHVETGTDNSWCQLNSDASDTFTQVAGDSGRYMHIGALTSIGAGELADFYVGYAYASSGL